MTQPTREEIALRAYFLYLERNRSAADIDDLIGVEKAAREDWYEAEFQLRQPA